MGMAGIIINIQRNLSKISEKNINTYFWEEKRK